MTSLFSDLTPENALERLAEEVGIQPVYWDIAGHQHITSTESKRAILKAMGIDAETNTEALYSLKAWREQPWNQLIPPVIVLRRTGPHISVTVDISIKDYLEFSPLNWILDTENGETHEATCHVRDLPVIDVADVNGQTITQHRLHLPDTLPDGYHQLTVCFAGKTARTQIIIAPFHAYIPNWMEAGKRQWGLSCQTYALRNEKDWGIGDFSTLSDFMKSAKDLGATMVGINPVHALFTPWPDACSPYSPSSRVFINPLMIAIDDIPFAKHSPSLKKLRNSQAFKKTLKAVRAAADVDYPTVSDLKIKALQALYDDFLEFSPPEEAEFEDFCEHMGKPLQRFAQFCSLHETLGGTPWQSWPHQFRNPASLEVAAFSTANVKKITFHAFLQWLCDVQFKATVEANPEVGLYRDLAIGSNYDGADAWSHQKSYAKNISFGAPPDAFSAIGQDWGLPPPHPHVQRKTGYKDFISIVRSNMRHAKALRIDHVMGLLRLFWIPCGSQAIDGAYISYPLDDFLGILALESHRNQCLVIGEDLGTVPDDFREKMAAERLLSYRVLYFECWESGLFRRPDTYPALALATPTTHDMPTIAGHWLETDIKLREDIGTFGSDEDIRMAYEDREKSRAALAAALVDQDLASSEDTNTANLTDITHGALRYIAKTPSRLLMINLGDLLMEQRQINLPGTVDEHPNWRQRMQISAKDIATNAKILAGVAEIKKERIP